MNYVASTWYWFVGGDETRAWSSAANAYVDAADAGFVAWRAAGGSPTLIDTEENLWEVLRTADVPPFHSIRTATLVQRLEAVSLADAADTYMNANKPLWRRFYTVCKISADDTALAAMITAIGADASTILAPE